MIFCFRSWRWLPLPGGRFSLSLIGHHWLGQFRPVQSPPFPPPGPRTSCRSTLIGIDIGTTAVKAVLVDLDGRVPRRRGPRAPLSDRPPAARPGSSRIRPTGSPASRWQHSRPSPAKPRPRRPPRHRARPGQVNTHVFVDAALRPVRPAIVWQDARRRGRGCGARRDRFTRGRAASPGSARRCRSTRATPCARMAWVAAPPASPTPGRPPAHVLAPKDFLLALALTGAVAADRSPPSASSAPTSATSPPLVARVDGAARRLAPLADPARRRRPGAGRPALRRRPGDRSGRWTPGPAMFGVGVAAPPGQAMYLSGTSEILGPDRPGARADPRRDRLLPRMVRPRRSRRPPPRPAAPPSSGSRRPPWPRARRAPAPRRGGAEARAVEPALPAAPRGRAGAAMGPPAARRLRRADHAVRRAGE